VSDLSGARRRSAGLRRKDTQSASIVTMFMGKRLAPLSLRSLFLCRCFGLRRSRQHSANRRFMEDVGLAPDLGVRGGFRHRYSNRSDVHIISHCYAAPHRRGQFLLIACQP
jgi:hypothetical protein